MTNVAVKVDQYVIMASLWNLTSNEEFLILTNLLHPGKTNVFKL